jgi:hypothetical protein
MNRRILFITRPDQQGLAEDVAMEYASANKCSFVVLFILDSHLYHYGNNDVVVPGYARSQFLFHIRTDLLRQAAERESSLRAKAEEFGLDIRVSMAEVDNFEEKMIKEASKGYRFVFVNRERRKLFPLFCSKTMEKMLQRKGFENVVAC